MELSLRRENDVVSLCCMLETNRIYFWAGFLFVGTAWYGRDAKRQLLSISRRKNGGEKITIERQRSRTAEEVERVKGKDDRATEKTEM